MSAYYLNNINYIPLAGDSVELSASAMTPMINDSDRVFPDDTNVTVSESSDADTFKLEDENSTNTSVKKMKSLILAYYHIAGNFEVFDAFQPDRQNLTYQIFKAMQHLVRQ